MNTIEINFKSDMNATNEIIKVPIFNRLFIGVMILLYKV
jgi:hypothetical protein